MADNSVLCKRFPEPAAAALLPAMDLLPDVFNSDSLMGWLPEYNVRRFASFRLCSLCCRYQPMSHRQSSGNLEPPDPADDRDHTHPLNAGGPLKQRRMASLFAVLAVVFMVAIVVIPLFYTSFFDELGRWQLAAAWEQRLNGQLEAAINRLTLALDADPHHVEMYLQRAEWYDQLGDREAALRDYNKVQELVDNDRRMLLGRAMTYHGMGKPAESIGDLEQLLEASSGQNRAKVLNILAYVRGLNNTDLDKALLDIDESIDMLGADAALLDTRGFIHYQLGDFEAARDDLEDAVKAYSEDLRSAAERRPKGGQSIVDPRVDQLRMQEIKETLAVIVYHRGLIYEKLGEMDLAQIDFDRVRDLGFEPNDDLY